MTVKKYRVFLYGHYDKEIEWINNMSKIGLNLMKKHGCFYVFLKSDQQKIYAKDFLPRSMPEDLKNSRIEEYKMNNIDFLLKSGNWYYFCRDIQYGSYQLHDSNDHYISFLVRMRNYMIALITLLMIVFEMTFDKIADPYLQLTYIVFYLVLAFLIIIHFLSVLRQLKKEKNK